MLKKLRFPDFIIYLFLIISGAVFLALSFSNQNFDLLSFKDSPRYLAVLLLEPLKKAGLWVLVFYLAILIFRLVVFLTSSYLKKIDLMLFFSRLNIRKRTSSFLSELKEVFKTGITLIFSLLLLSLALSKISEFSSFNLKSELLFDWDFLITGKFPFLFLHSFSYPNWFASAVIFSFSYLGVFLIFFCFYLFYKHRRLFKEFISAFCLALLIMLPFWLVLPALSPQNRFIDNIYHLPVSQSIQQALAETNFNKSVFDFLEEMKEPDAAPGSAPISTFPSAHIAWAVLAGYYAYRLRRLAVILISPFLILSSFGTVFLGQHYFVDVPAGIIAATIAILITNYFIKNKKVVI